MKEIFFELSKYIFAFLLMYYTYASYRGSTIHNENKRRYIYKLQNFIMFTFHFMGYLILYLQEENIDYAILYLEQFVFLFVIIAIYDNVYPKASRLLINNMCMLMSIGFIMLARLSYDKCVKQFMIAVAGTIIAFFIPWLLKKVRSFRRFAWLYCIVGLALLVSVLLGSRIFGANLVLTIGVVSVQPAEFVKIIFVMFIASMFNKSTDFKQIVITTVVAGAHVLILVASNDLGAALIFFVVYLMMLYEATKKTMYLLGGLVAGSVSACVAYELFSHVRTRVLIWLDPWTYIDDQGYQITQSLFSIGMGSWFGVGLCSGMPYKIPVAEKDFMFSAITEEFGVVFSVCIILICLNCLMLMMNIASMCKTNFYRLVAVGLAVTYGFQVFLTVGGVMKLIPLTGVTLPFVSYGGSSMISSIILFAIINGMYIMRQDEGESNEADKKTGKVKINEKEKNRK
ncbi:FtsW/RodA/SpoVE family cell cycle protein [[Clostridium] fimetarium]|uniref:Cell division protein FtsW n=1 Tax=[Clostridium] fimetarium TaxID=99656 RepID=A0A1I0QM93_9FIRM|nr:FtsW/RodA/SpoVE family cell cycle protein [[Clostridium] fimetarium]SEW28320.1 cell division protein FtsW [[Clostridium] fimetarium]